MTEKRAKKMQNLGAILKDTLEDQGIEGRIREEGAVAFWEEIVGESIAKNTKAVKIYRGELLVEVKSAAWKQQIQMMKRQIISKINQRLGKGTVKQIRFT
jgi:predicted nucleic acid-binding Zn ribbon protein